MKRSPYKDSFRAKLLVVTDKDLRTIVQASESCRTVINQLQLPNTGSATRVLREILIKKGISFSHFKGQGYNKGKKKPLQQRFSAVRLEKLFSMRESPCGTFRLKEAMKFALKILEQCAICGLGTRWNNQVLVLQLDHIDGNRNNNIINNLRFICPNCHSQTKTFCGRNKKIKAGVVQR